MEYIILPPLLSPGHTTLHIAYNMSFFFVVRSFRRPKSMGNDESCSLPLLSPELTTSHTLSLSQTFSPSQFEESKYYCYEKTISSTVVACEGGA